MIRLLELRTEKGLSQREIAKQLHVSQGTYNNWENSKTQPSIEQLIALSALFGVSVDYIIGNADDCGTIGAETQSAEERAFVGYFRSLSKSAQTALLQFMQNFIEK
jgi:transcriptional regulator with XRE-family HTH domain